MIKNVYWSSRNVPTYSCEILIKIEDPRHISKNPLISNFLKIRTVGAKLFHAERRTDAQIEDGQAER